MRLVLSNICQSFAGQTLFTIPQLTIESGVAVHLHGPNGSGKSTLMKIIAGLNKPTTGKVERIYDRAQLHQRPAVIYLHQQAYLFDTHVRANVEYGLKLRGEQNPRKVDEALAWAHLEDIQHRAAHHLSGGERQRLALARALVLGPQIILLDEPGSNLDMISMERIREMLNDLNQQGTGYILASHQENILSQDCAHNWYLRDQQLITD